MPHRPRGAYIGGHTVIGPGSGWFSKSKPKIKAKKKPKPLSAQEASKRQEAEEEKRRRAGERQHQARAERRERQRKAEEDAAARRAARIAARNSPEAKAKTEVKVVARRQHLEAKMAKITVVKQSLAPRRGKIAAPQSDQRGLNPSAGGRSSRFRPRIQVPPVKKAIAGSALAQALPLAGNAGEPTFSSRGRESRQREIGADNGIILFTAFGRFAAG
jgi:colicin import membrane protein